MIKAIVVAKDFSQFATYIRNRKFKREEYGCFRWGNQDDCINLSFGIPVHWLEGWNENPNVNDDDVEFLHNHFDTHKIIQEKRIYNEGIVF